MVRMPYAVLVLGALLGLPLAIHVLWMLVRAASIGFAVIDEVKTESGTLAAYVSLALLSAVIWSSRWWVDDSGVERRFVYLPRVRLGWDGVHAVRASPRECILTGPGTVRVRIVAGWVGYGFFVSKVLQHVVAARQVDEETRRELEAHARDHSPVWDHYPAFEPDAVASSEDAVRRWRENPFFVLGLSPECTRADVERTGQKLLGLLALEVTSARSYASPFGSVLRTADDVRAAMAELRDPDRRILHEVWARLSIAEGEVLADEEASGPAPWKESMAALGWRRL
jgi:hypothetical protein